MTGKRGQHPQTDHHVAVTRFDELVSMCPITGCWMWQGSFDRHGYGQVSIRRKMQRAHRVFYRAYVGEIPSGLVIDHICRCRWCVNPAHMDIVSMEENMRRGMSPHATHGRQDVCHLGHELTPYVGRNGRSHRRCRQCNKAAVRRYNERRRHRNCAVAAKSTEGDGLR